MRPRLSSLSLKALKAVLAVAGQGNVSRAAQTLNRSQTAVSKAVSGVETALGVSLFDRNTSGLIPTDAGSALVLRIREAQAQLDGVAHAYRDQFGPNVALADNPALSLGVSHSRYQALLMVERCASVKDAAKQLGSTSNAVYNSINTLGIDTKLEWFVLGIVILIGVVADEMVKRIVAAKRAKLQSQD